jgi:hypothetical protein
MNRYILIRRLRGPVFLLLLGVNALLAQAHILSWGRSWPLYLILAGIFALAERAALSADGGYPAMPFSGQPYAGAPHPCGGAVDLGAENAQRASANTAAIVPAHSSDFDRDPNGGQS